MCAWCVFLQTHVWEVREGAHNMYVRRSRKTRPLPLLRPPDMYPGCGVVGQRQTLACFPQLAGNVRGHDAPRRTTGEQGTWCVCFVERTGTDVGATPAPKVRITAPDVEAHHFFWSMPPQGCVARLRVRIHGVPPPSRDSELAMRSAKYATTWARHPGQRFDKQPHSTKLVPHICVFCDLTSVKPDVGKGLCATHRRSIRSVT